MRMGCGDKHCGKCYAGKKGRMSYPGHFGWRPAFRGHNGAMPLCRRPPRVPGAAGGPAASVSECDLSREWAALWEFLSATKWSDGKPRECGTVLVLCEAGRWKAWLHDKHDRQSAWVTADTLRGVLSAADEAVGSDQTEWRPDKGTASRGR